MKGSESAFGYEVTYTSGEESFTTNQVHRPVDGRFFQVSVVRPVVFEAQPGWKIDASDPYVPVVIGPTGQRLPLNRAISAGNVVAVDKWERDQVEAVATSLGQAQQQGIAG